MIGIRLAPASTQLYTVYVYLCMDVKTAYAIHRVIEMYENS